MGTTYYFVKPDQKKWRGDDHGAKSAALTANENAQRLDTTNFEDLEQPATIYVKGTNLKELVEELKKSKEQNKSFDISKINFHIGGNQTELTLKTIKELLDLGVQGKNINAEVLPNGVDLLNSVYYSYLKQVKFSETCAAITGISPSQLEEKFETNTAKSEKENTDASKAQEDLKTLETQVGENTPFVTIHWGGPIAGEALSDAEQKEHKEFLVHRIKALQARNPNTKFLFVHHGGRSFKFQNDTKEKTIQNLRKDLFIEALQKAVGKDNLVLPSYRASLAFTQKNAENCSTVIATAENLSTIAEQFSVIDQNKRPPLEVALLDCCKQNNNYWQSMAKVKDAWLIGVKKITLVKPKELLKSVAQKNPLSAFSRTLNALTSSCMPLTSNPQTASNERKVSRRNNTLGKVAQ